jgi:hypothetical protein
MKKSAIVVMSAIGAILAVSVAFVLFVAAVL